MSVITKPQCSLCDQPELNKSEHLFRAESEHVFQSHTEEIASPDV